MDFEFPDEIDPVSRDEPLLAAISSASVRGRIATGPRAGQAVLRFGDRVDADHLPASQGERCANVGGVSVHANVAVPPRDRHRLERLCRYAARPPLAIKRLSRLADGRLLYALRHRWRDGTTHVGFEPLEFIEKLAALVPPPRVNVVRYHGVLAPAARHRARVVPSESVPAENGSTHADCETKPSLGRHSEPEDSQPGPRTRNYSWAELMRRVFEVDVLECPACQGPMRVLAAIHPPEATRAILDCLGLPSRSPPVSPPARDTSTVLTQGF